MVEHSISMSGWATRSSELFRLGPDAPKPHPCVPAEVKTVFQEGSREMGYRKTTTHPSSSPSKISGSSQTSFWDAPSRLTRAASLKEDEMEAIEVLYFSYLFEYQTDFRTQSGGASLHK
jgi:hypothetical protein